MVTDDQLAKGNLKEKHRESVILANLPPEIVDAKVCESGERDSEFADLLPQIVFETDIDGIVTFANRKAYELLGYTREDVRKGVYALDLIAPEDQERVRRNMRLMITGESSGQEYMFLRKDGSRFPVIINSNLIYRQGKLAGIRGIIIDITERKKAEEDLRKLSTAVEQSPTSVKIVGLDGKITYVNPKFQEMTGYESAHVIGMNTWEINGVDTDQATIRNLHSTITSGRDWHGELQCKKKSGETFWVRSHISPIKDEKGTTLNFVEINEDITERRMAEGRMTEHLQFLQTLIDTIPVPVIYRDADQRYTGCNAAFEQFVGKTRDAIIGKKVHELYPPEFADLYVRTDKELLQTHGYLTFEGQFKHADDSIRDVVFYKTVFYDNAANAEGIIGAMIDITERKKMEEQLRSSLREKDVLLKEVHHRVKNNLQIISSLLNLHMAGVGQEPVRLILAESQNRIKSIALVHERIYKSDDLARIDFLEYARSLGKQLLNTYLTSSGNVALRIEGDSIYIGVDQAVPCGLIMNELVSNSFKHAFSDGRRGTINIRLADGNGRTITVEDDGVGVPADFSMESTQSMGMQLVTALVEQLDGTIKLDRTRGTMFTITFPAR